MSDNDTTAPGAPEVDPVQQLLQSNNGGQPMSTEQRNDRREALLKRQRESREKAQQMSAAARANAAPTSAPATTTATPTTTALASTTAPAAPAPAPVAAAPVVVADAPVRENMVQQAVSFLSSASVQSAEESKKTAFLEKKGLTLKEIELARARMAGTAAAPAPVSTAPVAFNPQQQQQQPQAPATYQATGAPPPVPPRTYAPAQGYPIQQQQPMYIPQQQVAVDPNAFKKKVVLALLISGGVTVLASVIVKKLIYPMIRGITGARQSLAVSQTEILSKLKEKLLDYKEYLVGLHLGSNRAPVVKKIEDSKDASGTITDKDENSNTSKKTTIEDVEEDGTSKAVIKTTTTTTTTTKSTTASGAPYVSTVKQLDAFSQKLESHSNQLNFEQLKATRAMAQDLAEYITKETYSLSTSIAYPTSRYYGYNTGAAAASGKAGGLADPTTPESALKSEIRSLKGLLLNWRNFPVAKDGGAGVGGFSSPVLPNLVQQQ
ncbi:hypothetical protein KI688_000905 [Linnemannia hyalina]|uniref:Peroxisomal membrane protein PEX14 n=1 Tax=Linnemannia hyalina TaxID=64524 RepID=A0A9P8BZ14_9FUNG|nr:hypothetical protein KI688_000905 [Linnemannia hyalina]